MSDRPTIHLIANAHLDPVWLWDSREGASECISTGRAVLDLMDEFPEMTFVRGETSFYEQVEAHAPELFARLRQMVEAGRWELVGGTFVQPDMNLASTETLLKQFIEGQSYFRRTFGRVAETAWMPDAFGHSAGVPNILYHAGIRNYAFCRPQQEFLRLSSNAFIWEGAKARQVLAYRSPSGTYQNERFDMKTVLDAAKEDALRSPLRCTGCFYGLGNHGGGTTRRHLLEIRQWAEENPGVEVIHSSFAKMFSQIRKGASEALPIVRGELNFVMRGCYSSAARLKFLFRKAEHISIRAERATTTLSTFLGEPLPEVSWKDVLFNSFHDILPGSSIERACEEQMEWLSSSIHHAREAEYLALRRLAGAIDGTPDIPSSLNTDSADGVAFLAWNPHPYPIDVHIELEGSLDWRPAWDYLGKSSLLPIVIRGPKGEPIPHQEIPVEHHSYTDLDLPWRKRVMVKTSLPALGWKLLSMERALESLPDSREDISLPLSAKAGDRKLEIEGGYRISFVTCVDEWGSWGGMKEEKESLDLNEIVAESTVLETNVIQQGPECARVHVILSCGDSRIGLIVSSHRARPCVEFFCEVQWREKGVRLKLRIEHPTVTDSQATFEVPGGVVERPASGEVPGGRWVRMGQLGFASNALANFNTSGGVLSATICRSALYACARKGAGKDAPWRASMDQGQLKFDFILSQAPDELKQQAALICLPPLALPVPRSAGHLPKTGSIMEFSHQSLRLLDLRKGEASGECLITLQGSDDIRDPISVTFAGRKHLLGRMRAGDISTWLLGRQSTKPADLI